MNFAPELATHAQRVCNFYKRAMRTLESYYIYRDAVRYRQVMMRHEFDKNKCERDPKEQRRLLWVGENDLFMVKHPTPVAKFAKSIGIAGGVAYGRVVDPPDWVLDYWHPLEKARYPTYFCKREAKKCEYIVQWNNGTVY